VAAALAGASAVSAWWTIFTSTGGEISFRPGGTFYLYSTRVTDSAVVPFASVGLGPVEALCESILVLAVALLVLGALLGILAALSVLGRLRAPAARTAVRRLLVLAVVTAVFAVAVAPILQPTLAERSSQGLGLCTATNGSSASPCHSFWGTGMGSAGHIAWGADVGWFLMLVAAVFFLLALLVALPSKPAPTPPQLADWPAPTPPSTPAP
jgi:hypothetical protein